MSNGAQERLNVEVHSFSGRHRFQLACLGETDAYAAGTADQIVADVNSGICPRCQGPLPRPPEYPAGSRITRCRCIPICSGCGSDEAHEEVDGWGLSPAGCWPVAAEEIEEHGRQYQRQVRSAILTDDGHLIGQDGVIRVTEWRHRDTGGWAYPDNGE